jgi:hypothetical protein
MVRLTLFANELAIVATDSHSVAADSDYLQLKTAGGVVLDVGPQPNIGTVGLRV